MTRRLCWRSIQNNFFLKNLLEKHGRLDITCKQLRGSRLFNALQFDVLNKHILFSSSWTGGHFVCACVNKVCWSKDWPVRLGYVTETNWPRGTGKTPYRDQAKYPPLSTVPPPNLNTHVPAAPPSYSFIPFAQQQGFDWFRLQSEEFQLAQQQSFVWFEEFPFLLSNKVLIGAKCTLVCFLIIALQMRRFFTLKMSLLSFSQICIFFFILAHCTSLAYFRP